MAEPARATSGEAVPDVGAEVEAVLARFDGDACAALAGAGAPRQGGDRR